MFGSSAGAKVAAALGLGVVGVLAFNMVLGRLWTLGLIALVFVPLERLIPFHPKQRLLRRFLGQDFLHFFFGGIVVIVFVRVTFLLPYVWGWTTRYVSPLSVRGLPGWLQFVIFELGWTGLGYWLHRLMHSYEPLWRMHSIHESSQELDWLAGFRLHWLEPCLFHALTVVPLYLILQVDYPVAVAYTIYAFVTAHVQHANVIFPIGPLKYILPTPQFHRWHHASDPVEGSGGTRNFGQYPFWDLIFGTLHLPKEPPTRYGYRSAGVPMDCFAQQVYPFGLHETVLSWERSFWAHFPFRDRLANVQRGLSPLHEGFERQLQRLSLTGSRTAADQAYRQQNA